MLAAWLGLGLTLALGASADAPAKPLEPKPTTLQVLALAPENGVDPASAKILTDFLASELGLHRELRVFGQSDLEALLREAKDRRAVGCDGAADSCLSEVAGALGAQWLLTGTVGRLGEALVLNVRVLDTHKHTVLAQLSKVTGAEQSQLLRAVDELVPELLRQLRIGAPDKPAQSPVPFLLGAAAVAGLLTFAIAGAVSIVNYQANAAARSDFQKGLALPTGYASTNQYSATQSSLQTTSLIADLGLVVGVGFGLATAFTW